MPAQGLPTAPCRSAGVGAEPRRCAPFWRFKPEKPVLPDLCGNPPPPPATGLVRLPESCVPHCAQKTAQVGFLYVRAHPHDGAADLDLHARRRHRARLRRHLPSNLLRAANGCAAPPEKLRRCDVQRACERRDIRIRLQRRRDRPILELLGPARRSPTGAPSRRSARISMNWFALALRLGVDTDVAIHAGPLPNTAPPRQTVPGLRLRYAEGFVEKAEFEPRITGMKQRFGAARRAPRSSAQSQRKRARPLPCYQPPGGLAAKVSEGLDKLDRPGRRDIIRALVKRIEVDGDGIEIISAFRLPKKPVRPASPSKTRSDCQQCTAVRRADVQLARTLPKAVEGLRNLSRTQRAFVHSP